MKPSGKDWNENKLDALFFEYLEGNLSAEGAEALEQRLAENDALQTELELWQETVVEQEFYNTEWLEKSLYKEIGKPVDISYSTPVFLLVLVLSLFRFLPLNEQKGASVPATTVVVPKAANSATPMEKQSIAPVAGAKPALPKRTTFSTLPQQPQSKLVANGNTLPENRMIATITPIISHFTVPTSPDKIDVPKVKIRQVSVVKTYVKRSSTRKERRKIERMKERARQKRMASKFLKGNTPYVVPLNSTNF
jgi:hypothetical protein